MTATISLPAPPQGVEVELSGRVVICTDGTGTGNVNNTLLIYDSTQPSTSQVQAVTIPPPAATPPSLAPVTAKPSTTINGRLQRTPDGNYIIGVLNTGTGGTLDGGVRLRDGIHHGAQQPHSGGAIEHDVGFAG